MKANYSSKLRVNKRRRIAVANLHQQLTAGVKHTRRDGTVALTPKDIERIRAEITILDARIASNEGAHWSRQKRSR
jgi:hypothetical protein